MVGPVNFVWELGRDVKFVRGFVENTITGNRTPCDKISIVGVSYPLRPTDPRGRNLVRGTGTVVSQTGRRVPGHVRVRGVGEPKERLEDRDGHGVERYQYGPYCNKRESIT